MLKVVNLDCTSFVSDNFDIEAVDIERKKLNEKTCYLVGHLTNDLSLIRAEHFSVLLDK